MRRRALLRGLGGGAVGIGGGCLGLGGDVVVEVHRDLTIDPGDAWVKQIPDVSDPGGAISYTVRSDDGPFDVYFFVGRGQYEHYDAFVGGGDPATTPVGNERLSTAAVPQSGDGEMYQAATHDDGAREPLNVEGPYYFAVDYTSYRMENPVDEYADPLGAFVDLTVVKKRF
ncbi:MAG: hypothetical protein ABEJ89_08145 [Haloarculaceae archaeon]